MTDDPDLIRRHLIGRGLPVLGAATTLTSASYAAPASRKSEGKVVDVTEFGARGDGQTNDRAAFVAALNVARTIDVPPGRFSIDAPLVLRDGQTLRGAGRAGWEPYTGRGAPASAVKTELVVERGTAIDARNTNNAAVAGLAIRARDARQSAWAYEPGFQPGTIGIDMAGSLQFTAQDLSFHGLETGVSGVADTGRAAQMPTIESWSAHDCATVFRFVSTKSDFTAVRDARIASGIAAVHCGRIIEVKHCDGLRIENVRFFQCVRNAILIEETPFVSIIGATMFETGDETLVLRNCSAVTMAGVQVVRAGFYHAPPRVQRAAILLEECRDLAFDGLVEQPMGRAFTVRDCHNLSINGTVGTPFWSTGSLGSNDGAIFIERSRNIAINAAFSGTDYWIAVWSDAESAASVCGRIATDDPAGTVRCVQLQSAPLGHIVRTTNMQIVPPGGTIRLDTLRVLVPSQRTLVTRSVELTGAGILAQAGDQRWVEHYPEPGGGSLSLERRELHRNDTGEARYASIPLGVYNPTATTAAVPAGHEMRVSMAIESSFLLDRSASPR